MPWILKVLAGQAGGWILAGALLAATAAGGAVAWAGRGVLDAPVIATARLEAAQCVASHEKGRADGAEAAITAINQAAANARTAAAELARKARERDDANARFLQELSNVPTTNICGGSAAELAYRRSVQRPAP